MKDLAPAILFILTATCAGCMDVTRALWSSATTTDWTGGTLHGMVVDAEGKSRSLVVEYTRPWVVLFHEPRYIVLPVDGAGRALPPYAAPELESSTDLRHASVNAAHLRAVGRAEAKLLREVSLPPGHRMVRVRSIEQRMAHSRARIIAYELPGDDAEPASPAAQPQHWPFHAEGVIEAIPDLPLDRVLIVPGKIPRTPLERGKSIAGATLLTPVAVVMDVTLVPLLYVGMCLTGEWL